MKHLIDFLKPYNLQSDGGKKECSRDLWNKFGIQIQYNEHYLIVRYQRWSNTFTEDNSLVDYCRGTVLDISNLKPACYTFRKRLEYTDFTEKVPFSEVNIYKYYDGTMVNVYYNTYTNSWNHSTKGRLDATKSKWYSNRSFQELFTEACPLDYDQLDKNVCYSFVLQHHENRIVSNIDVNRVVLVLARLVDTDQLVDITTIENLPPHVHLPERLDITENNISSYPELEKYVNDLDFNEGGVILSGPNEDRTRLMSSDYTNAAEVRGNYQNKMLNIISLSSKQLEDYLFYYPEDTELCQKIETLTRRTVSSVFYFYQRVKVKKIYTDIPVHLRKLVHMVHQLYETRLTKMPGRSAAITHRVLKGYFYSLPNKHILQLLCSHEKYLNSGDVKKD